MNASELLPTANRSYRTGDATALPEFQLIDSLAVPFIAVDDHDYVIFINESAKHLLGLPAPLVLGQHWSKVVRFCDRAHRRVILVPSGQAAVTVETESTDEPWLFVMRDDGSRVPVQLSFAPLANNALGDASVHGIGVVLYDQSSAQRLVERLTHRCEHDDLTGLVNRTEFEKRLAIAIRGARCNGHMHALCFMDLNEFKAVNDRHGHQAGDEVLQYIANRFRTLIRERDTLARLGGDEFALLMEHCTVEHAVNTARLMRFTLKQSPLIWHEKRVSVGISIGITIIDQRSVDCRAALSAADAACYAAKREGYDSICVVTAHELAVDANRCEQYPPH